MRVEYMSHKELNFNDMGLSSFQSELEKQKEKLLQTLHTMKQTDETLSETLRGESQRAYEARAKLVAQNLLQSIEIFDTLIKQVGQVNQAAAETDKEISEKMIT